MQLYRITISADIYAAERHILRNHIAQDLQLIKFLWMPIEVLSFVIEHHSSVCS